MWNLKWKGKLNGIEIEKYYDVNGKLYGMVINFLFCII